MPLFTLTPEEYAELYPNLSTAKFVLTYLTKVFDIFGTSTMTLNYDIQVNSDLYKIKTCATLFRMFTLKCYELAIVPAFPELFTYDAATEQFELVKVYFDLAFHYAVYSQKCTALIETLLTNDQGNQADKFSLKSQYKDKLLNVVRGGYRFFGGIVRRRQQDVEEIADPYVFYLAYAEYDQVNCDIEVLEFFKKHEKTAAQFYGKIEEPRTIIYRFFAAELQRRLTLQKQINSGAFTFLIMFRDTLKVLLGRVESAVETRKQLQSEADLTVKTGLTEQYNELCQYIDEDWLAILELKLIVEYHQTDFEGQAPPAATADNVHAK